MAESHQQKRARIQRIKRPRLNSKGKRRERGRASMKLKLEKYKEWLDTVIGRLEEFTKKEKGDGNSENP